jgi:adenylate cyclase
MAFSSRTGDPKVRIRVGIHVGPLQVEGNDVFGGTVNFAARVVAAIDEAEIWLSDRAKEDLSTLRAERHEGIKWQRHEQVQMKGFHDSFTLWSLQS